MVPIKVREIYKAHWTKKDAEALITDHERFYALVQNGDEHLIHQLIHEHLCFIHDTDMLQEFQYI